MLSPATQTLVTHSTAHMAMASCASCCSGCCGEPGETTSFIMYLPPSPHSPCFTCGLSSRRSSQLQSSVIAGSLEDCSSLVGIGQAVLSERILWMLDCAGARVDTRALRVLRSKAAQSFLLSSLLFSTALFFATSDLQPNADDDDLQFQTVSLT